MPETNGDYGWEKHIAERRRIWESIQGLVEHAKVADRRIEILRESQLETNESVKSLVGAIRVGYTGRSKNSSGLE